MSADQAFPRPELPRPAGEAADGRRAPGPGPVTRVVESSALVPATYDPAAQATFSAFRSRAPRPASAFAPGQRFGRYRLDEPLGRGGMGEVHLARDTVLDRRVALKLSFFDPAVDGLETLERFYREARAAATLAHPNVCPVHDVGQVDDVHFMAMAYIEGEPLSTAIEHEAPMAQARAAGLVRTLALALDYAHSRGVIHRDLKPSNVMIRPGGEPVIIDFGLARRIDAEPRLTKTGTVLGTPHYMPPEQVEGNILAMGPASDVYSLGVILFELLTSRRPFEGSIGSVLGKILYAEPPLPSAFQPGLDVELEAICRKAMAKAIGDRYRSMVELAAALGAYLGRRSNGHDHPDGPPSA